MRIVHYINQFFAGIGGEEAAETGIERRSAPVGPGLLLRTLLPDAEITTVVCGDNYASANPSEVLAAIQETVEQHGAEVVVLGPAFNAGRYGLVCGEVAAEIPTRTGVPAITGLFEENAATSLFRNKALIVRTGKSAAGMRSAMETIAALIPRIVGGEDIGDREAAGLYGSTARRSRLAQRSAADRAIDMLLDLLTSDDVGTELAVPDYEPVEPPASVRALASAKVALVTEGGLVPTGNPDRLTTGWSEKWAAYPIRTLLESPGSFEAIHGGYDTRFVNESPYRLVPADVMSELSAEGIIGSLHDKYYVTAGMATPVKNARKMGAEIAAVLLNEGVQAVVLTST